MLLSVQRLWLRLLRVLEKEGRDGVEGTLISRVVAGRCMLEERAAGELVIDAVEVSSGAVGAVAGVTDNHLWYNNRERLWTLRMVQYGRVQGDYHLNKRNNKHVTKNQKCTP